MLENWDSLIVRTSDFILQKNPLLGRWGNETDNKKRKVNKNMRYIFLSPMSNKNNGYINIKKTKNTLMTKWNEKEGISIENTHTLFCIAGKWSQLGFAHFDHSYSHVQVERSCTDTPLPRSLFSLCSLLLLLTISSITKSSKTPTKIQEMVTSIFSPSLVPSPSSLCTTDLMRGGIVPGNRVMPLEAY